MKNNILFTAATIIILLTGSCKNDKSEPDNRAALPRVKSFVWNGAPGMPEFLSGLNEFGYDSEGRVTSYVTPMQKATYTYNSNICSGTLLWLPSEEKWQEQTITFNQEWRPLIEESTDFGDDATASSKYEYDSNNRLKTYEISISDGRYKRAEFTYDSTSGLISEATVIRREGAGKEDFTLKYRYTYTDKTNPVALYPECIQWFDSEPAFAYTGIDGYGHSLLIDNVTMSVNGIDDRIFSFTYEFSEDGKLTTITETASVPDENGNPVQTVPAMTLSEITY